MKRANFKIPFQCKHSQEKEVLQNEKKCSASLDASVVKKGECPCVKLISSLFTARQ